MPASFIHVAAFGGWPYNWLDEEIAVAQMLLKAYRKRYPLVVIGKAFEGIWAELYACKRHVSRVYLPKPIDWACLMEGPLSEVGKRLSTMRIHINNLVQKKLFIIVYDVDSLVRDAFYAHDVFSGHELLSTLPLAPGEEAYLCANDQILSSRTSVKQRDLGCTPPDCKG
jgi:hypothetical protein